MGRPARQMQVGLVVRIRLRLRQSIVEVFKQYITFSQLLLQIRTLNYCHPYILLIAMPSLKTLFNTLSTGDRGVFYHYSDSALRWANPTGACYDDHWSFATFNGTATIAAGPIRVIQGNTTTDLAPAELATTASESQNPYFCFLNLTTRIISLGSKSPFLLIGNTRTTRA